MRTLARKAGDTGKPLRLSLGRDLTGVSSVDVRIARQPGSAAAVIDRAADEIEDPSEGVVRVDLTQEEVDVLEPGSWLVEARPDDGTVHPDRRYLELQVYEALPAGGS